MIAHAAPRTIAGGKTSFHALAIIAFSLHCPPNVVQELTTRPVIKVEHVDDMTPMQRLLFMKKQRLEESSIGLLPKAGRKKGKISQKDRWR